LKKFILLGLSLVSTIGMAGNPPFSISQNTDLVTVTEFNSVACPINNESYFRRFDLSGNHGLPSMLAISEVGFAVESASLVDLTVNLHAISDSDDLLMDNLLPIGSTVLSVSNLDNLALVSTAISGAIDGSLYDLVVEVNVPDTTDAATFYIGSNSNGESAPSYLLSPNCDVLEPTDLSALGYPNMHLIITVDGTVTGVGGLIFKDGFELNAP
jgi:hypothetical protein